MLLTISMPRPVPPSFEEVKKGSKSLDCTSFSIPSPVSARAISPTVPSSLAPARTCDDRRAQLNLAQLGLKRQPLEDRLVVLC